MSAHRRIVPFAAALLASLLAVAGADTARADPPVYPYPDGSPTTFTCVPGFPSSVSTCTTSAFHQEHDTRVDLPNAQVFSTRVLGTAVLTGPGISQSATVFDQTTLNPFGSAAVDLLFAQASAAAHTGAIALAAGRPFVAITETGPIRTASSTATGAAVLISHAATATADLPVSSNPNPTLFPACSTCASYAVFHAANEVLTITNTSTIGPGTVSFGPNGANLIFVPAGNVNVNTNFHYDDYYTDTYQATTTTSATYEITDTLLVQLIGTIHPAVQSAALGSGSDFLHRLGGAAASVDTDGDDPTAWGEGYGFWSHNRMQGMVPGNSVSTGGLAGGIGFAVAPGLSIGFGADQGWSRIDETAVFEHADLDLTQIGLNAAYTVNDWSFAFTFSGGTGSVDTTHGSAALGGVSNASYDVRTWGAQAQTGYRIALDGWSLAPKLGFDWTAVHTDAFAETGGLALIAPDHAASRIRFWLGVEADVPAIDLDTHILDLTGEARAVDVLSGRGRFLPVDFAGSPLEIEGLTEDRYAADVSASARLHLTEQASFFLSGELLYAGHADYTAAARAGFTISF